MSEEFEEFCRSSDAKRAELLGAVKADTKLTKQEMMFMIRWASRNIKTYEDDLK